MNSSWKTAAWFGVIATGPAGAALMGNNDSTSLGIRPPFEVTLLLVMIFLEDRRNTRLAMSDDRHAQRLNLIRRGDPLPPVAPEDGGGEPAGYACHHPGWVQRLVRVASEVLQTGLRRKARHIRQTVGHDQA